MTGVWTVPAGEYDSGEFPVSAFAVEAHGTWWVITDGRYVDGYDTDTHLHATFREQDDAETYVELCAGERAGPIND